MSQSSAQKSQIFMLLALISWASASIALSLVSVDTDRDGVEDSKDLDDDGDDILDSLDAFPTNSRYSEDSDLDGLPDKWERFYGLNPDDPRDALSDLDQDGLNASEEFDIDTSPNLKDSDRDTISNQHPRHW